MAGPILRIRVLRSSEYLLDGLVRFWGLGRSLWTPREFDRDDDSRTERRPHDREDQRREGRTGRNRSKGHRNSSPSWVVRSARGQRNDLVVSDRADRYPGRRSDIPGRQ